VTTQTPLNVLFTATSYPATLDDWRGVFMRHIAGALARRDDVALSMWAPPGPMPTNARIATTTAEARFLAKLMEDGGISHLLRTSPPNGAWRAVLLMRGLRRAMHARTADLYHVNWLQCALGVPADRKPLVATVLGNDMRLLALPGVTTWLRRVLRHRPAALCPNAAWMVEPLRQIFGDLALIRAVPFGIDPGWFEVTRKPEQPPRWLAVTRLTRDKLGPLFAWGEPMFSDGHRELHLIGPMQEQIELPSWVHYHGPLGPDVLKDQWFPACTGLLTLSQHAEGRPQVLLEAFAAGMPVVASPLAAHADLIGQSPAGRLVTSSPSFEEAVVHFEDATVNQAAAISARALATAEAGTWDDCAQRYIDVYRELGAMQ